MQKIPTLFVRDEENRRYVIAEVTSGCEWVVQGEGTATRKWDGTCVLLDDNEKWWARREVKPGKALPPGFVSEEHDENTGKWVGWEPIEQSAFAKIHAQALKNSSAEDPGTYELVGPKVNGNPDKFGDHILVRHGWAPFGERQDIATAPRDYDGLRDWLHDRPYEGLVYHHPDGRMAKIKRRDFRYEPKES